jgi:general secretion pathway protein I
MRTSGRRQNGFTLIEVMVAFAVFALSIGAIFELFAGATRRAEQARTREQLWLTAQSVLAEFRTRPLPWPANEEGQGASGDTWRLAIEPFDAGTDPDHPWKAYSVRVNVTSQRARAEVTLESVEIGRSVP